MRISRLIFASSPVITAAPAMPAVVDYGKLNVSAQRDDLDAWVFITLKDFQSVFYS